MRRWSRRWKATDTPGSRTDDEDREELHRRAEQAEDEITELRRRLQEAPGRVRTLEERLLETKGQLAHAVSQNEKLTFTLQQAKEHIAALREEVDKLTQPPSAYGTYLSGNDDGTVDVFASGRKMRVAVHPGLDADGAPQGPRGRPERVAERRPRPRPRARRRGRVGAGGARGRPPGARRRAGRPGAGGRDLRLPRRASSCAPATRC